MELLEKITLYDILGYTLPGGIVIYILNDYSLRSDLSTFGIIAFFTMSFLLGMLISQIIGWLTKWILNCKKVKLYMWKEVGLEVSNVSNALLRAGIIEKAIEDSESVWKHYVNIYSDIQVDKEYSRIHNYASAALLCKNMILVSTICAWKFGIENLVVQCLISIGAIFIFVSRWYLLKKRELCYVINWYVLKYAKVEAGCVKEMKAERTSF